RVLFRSSRLVNRKLFKIQMRKTPFTEDEVRPIEEKILSKMNLKKEDLHYFLVRDDISNLAYAANDESINILMKNGEVTDIATASDSLNITMLSESITKFFICYPKDAV